MRLATRPGQIGDGTSGSTAVTTPVQVSSLTGVTAIAAGLNHSLALKSDGSAWAWGQGSYGQLGNNGTGPAEQSGASADGRGGGDCVGMDAQPGGACGRDGAGMGE